MCKAALNRLPPASSFLPTGLLPTGVRLESLTYAGLYNRQCAARQ